MRHVLVFDVNETLLDLAALDPHFERALGGASFRRLWFAQMLQNALVSTVTGAYADFTACQSAALTMLAERQGSSVSESDRRSILNGMQQLPAHPEVRANLERLREAGFYLATLTNSTLDVAEAQLAYAGIRDLFEQVLSADTVRRLKPAREPYAMAAERLGVPLEGVRLIAAHAWDIAGALRAGCSAAFVARPGMVLDPLVSPPDVVGADLHEVADTIISLESMSSASMSVR